MLLKVVKNTVLFFITIGILGVTFSCGNDMKQNTKNKTQEMLAVNDSSKSLNRIEHKKSKIIVGANQTSLYLPMLKNKHVAVVANQTSVIFKDESLKTQNYTHLVDSLLEMAIEVKKVFAPEHGFRGTADAGELVKDGMDTKTGLPIISLYGKNKKPSAKQLKGIDIVVFDIQDVGARFYTYISSLHYVMEACAEQNIPLVIFDRPNPNGHYIDGPILEKEHQSFVGMHPIPVVHGMTIGEYAQMINGEKWLKNGVHCELHIIPVKNYTHQTPYSLPIKPSPNLPNDTAINLYPSLCFFEGTPISVGRGTDMQFQIAGAPMLDSKLFPFKFTPQPNEGAKYPKHENKTCFGYDLTTHKKLNTLHLEWLIEFYNNMKASDAKTSFFTDFFTLLAGTKQLQQQIESGLSEDDIKATWEEGLNNFKKTRQHYLLYQ